MVWQDARTGIAGVYAQGISSTGIIKWASDGVVLRQDVLGTGILSPQIVSDDAGGAIIGWMQDEGVFTIFADRLIASGVPAWTPGGVRVSVETLERTKMVRDSFGGAIFTYSTRAFSGLHDVYAQRLNHEGVAQWSGLGGTAISSAGGDQFSPEIVEDMAGGAIIAWTDTRNGNNDIYVQGVTAQGQQ
jgi:hypothetical protein